VIKVGIIGRLRKVREAEDVKIATETKNLKPRKEKGWNQDLVEASAPSRRAQGLYGIGIS
jgi:hypothetical protein